MKFKEIVSNILKLTLEVILIIYKLYLGLTKEFSTLFIQLRIEIIGFNDFLF